MKTVSLWPSMTVAILYLLLLSSSGFSGDSLGKVVDREVREVMLTQPALTKRADFFVLAGLEYCVKIIFQESLRIFGEVVRGAKKGRIVLQTRKAFQRAEAKRNETLRGGGKIEDFIGE